jgi:hypothetical protein
MRRSDAVFSALLIVAAASAAADDTKASTAVVKSKATLRMQEALLPSKTLFTPAEIKSHFDRQKITPFGEPSLYFEIVVPKTWDSRHLDLPKDTLAHDAEMLIPMAKLTPNDGDNAVIEVQYIRAPPEVGLPTFMEKYVSAASFRFVKRERGEFNGREVEDALLEKQLADETTEWTRLTASRRGNYIFVVACSVPEKKYDKYKKIFGLAAVTFDPAGK